MSTLKATGATKWKNWIINLLTLTWQFYNLFCDVFCINIVDLDIAWKHIECFFQIIWYHISSNFWFFATTGSFFGRLFCKTLGSLTFGCWNFESFEHSKFSYYFWITQVHCVPELSFFCPKNERWTWVFAWTIEIIAAEFWLEKPDSFGILSSLLLWQISD